MVFGFFVFSPGTDNYIYAMAFAVLVIAVTNWSIFRNRDKKAAKLYDQNRVFASAGRFGVKLFDDHFEVCTDHSQETVDYDRLYKIIDVPTHFYFMYSKVQGVIIVKESQDLCDLIHQVKEKYKL